MAIKIDSHHQYTLGQLMEEDPSIESDPIKTFQNWFKQAQDPEQNHGLEEPEAVCLATTDKATGIPSARMVLLKRCTNDAFVIFSNYDSRKGKEMTGNPYASLCFYWKPMQRQVRIIGRVEREDPKETEAYFKTRPLLSRVGAWASPQSQEIQSRKELEDRVQEVRRRFKVEEDDIKGRDESTIEIPVPPFWGGLKIFPHEVEFWQGGLGRLHDRMVYKRANEKINDWTIQRLSP